MISVVEKQSPDRGIEPVSGRMIICMRIDSSFFECDLCYADYVGFTSRHLHQRVEEHKRSVIGSHVREQHGNEPCEIAKNFRVLRKCRASSIV